MARPTGRRVTSSSPPLDAAGGTHPGRQRAQNEDRLFYDAERGVFCIVDGVGGHAAGDRAAEIAVDLLKTRLTRETGSPAERLREAIALANNAIYEAAQADASLAGMTCVLTAAIVSGGRVTVGHVGDTRLYELRRGEIRKLTHDHSPIGEREDAGELSELEAMRHPRRNEVFRDVGGRPRAPDDEEFVEIVEGPFEPDAALLLCTDGLSDQVSSLSLRRIIEAHAGRPWEAVAELVHAANDAGGKDNVSAIVVEGEAFARDARRKARARAGERPEARASTGAIGTGRMDGRSPRPARQGRGGRRPWAAFGIGLLLGAGLGAALVWSGPDLFEIGVGWRRAPAALESTVRAPRTWRVGLTADADAASIADAMARAAPGDTIALDPGEYREPVLLKQPVGIAGPREAILRPPLNAPAGWTAIIVSGPAGATLAGFSILGTPSQPLGVGMRLESAGADVRDVVVSGANEAGIEIGPGARAIVLGSVLHDNPGAGIVVRAGADLQLRHTAILRNGTLPGHPRAGVEIDRAARATLFGNAIGDNGGGAVTGVPEADNAALARDNVIGPPAQPRGGRSGPAPRRQPGASPR
jgi:serine/threonine protein phosphatase PrpC